MVDILLFNMVNKVTGIILLAGNSTRYKKNINKNFDYLNDKLVFLYSLDKFLENNNIDDVILVIRKSDKEFINNVLLDIKRDKNIKLVIGGMTRQESVYNALKSTDSKIVLVHDAARPVLKDKYINDCISSMNEYKGAITAIKVKDTIKISNDNAEIISSTNRNNTYIGQTPQAFDRELLLKLHEKYKGDINITDDSMLLERDGYKIKIVDGSYSNIKLTTNDDLIYLTEYLKKTKM